MNWIDAKKENPRETGTYLAVFLDSDKFVVLAYYFAEDNRWEVYDSYGGLWGDSVLYWMPIPKIPQ